MAKKKARKKTRSASQKSHGSRAKKKGVPGRAATKHLSGVSRAKKSSSPEREGGLNGENAPRVKMRFIGIGGGGGNIVNEIAQRVPRVDFIVANTDAQALRKMGSRVRHLAFGQEFTRGLGCGMDADLGEKVARAEKEKIQKALEGQDVCILVASLGGGTGSGAAPVFAQVASETKCLTLGIFTMPFAFEGERRQAIAKAALEKLKPLVNAYVVIPNENIFSIIDPKASLPQAFSSINSYLADSLEGLIETIYLPGLINVDFADLRALLEGRGRLAYLNSVKTSGSAKAGEAAQRVLANSLLGYGIEGTERMLFNISSDRNIKMQEVVEISSAISSFNPKAKIVFGISHQPKLKEKIRVSLFTVGCKEGGGAGNKKNEKESQEGEEETKGKTKKNVLKKKFPSRKKPEAKSGAYEEKEEEVKIRRTGLDVKKAVDKEIEELEQQEKEWDVPAFLRNR